MGVDKQGFIQGVSVVYLPLLLAYVDAEAYLEYHDVFDCSIDKVFAVSRDQGYTSYFSRKEIDNIRISVEEGGIRRIREKIDAFYVYLDKIDTWIEKSRTIDPGELDTAELSGLIKEFFAVSKPIMPYIPYIRYAEKPLIEELSRAIDTSSIEKLATPVIESAFIIQDRDLLQIAYDILQSGADKKARVRRHVDDYGWTSMHFSMDDPLTEDYVMRSLDKLLDEGFDTVAQKLKRSEENLDLIKKEQDDLRKAIDLNDRQKEMVGMLKRLAEVRIHIQDKQSCSSYILMPFMEEISSRIGIDPKDIRWLTPEEIQDLEKGKVEIEDKVNSRKKRYVLTIFDEELHILEDARADSFIRDLKQEQSGQALQLKGQVGYKGKVKGNAKIVINLDDFSKVDDGDILITPTTTPNFIPLFQKVKAIVTDSGGITSHAAIVSREMHIPCVIGTGNATSIFKDGDLIEVDADKGQVTKIC